MGCAVRLQVLGGFALRVGGREAPALPRKTRGLLAYLAVERGRTVTREQAGELLWSNRGSEQVYHSLRQALGQLRQLVPDAELIERRDGGLALAPDVECDAGLLLRLPAAAPREALSQAAAAYGGRLLDGFPPLSRDFDDWLPAARADLENRAQRALGELAAAARAAGDAAGALAAVERMFAIDPLREDIHRLLLEACAAAGRRSEALRHYEAIAGLLRRELGVAPARETRELAQRLRQEMDPAPAPPTAAPGPPTVAARPGAAGPPIAVLPFRQLGPEQLPSHVLDGLLVDVVCQLTGLRELSVISHGTTAALDDPALDPRMAGRLLNVRYAVRGTVQRAGNRLRVTTELTDAETGMNVWARAHDTDAALSFAEQDRVVAQIVNTLAPRVHAEELRRIRGRRPESLSVYEKMLLVREHMLALEAGSFGAARALLDEVLAAEPDYAEAHALSADWHGLSMTQGWAADRQAGLAAVEAAARRALALDPDNLRALVFYAHRKSLLHRDYAAAQAMFDRALALWPGSASAWLWSSYTSTYVEDTGEALRRAQRALDLSPRDRQAHDFYAAFCVANYVRGDWGAAAAWGLKALGEQSVSRATYRWTAAALVAAGEPARAREIAGVGMARQAGHRVAEVVAQSPLRDPARRRQYGAHLIAAGFPA